MSELDAQSLADHAVMLGLVTRQQAREAVNDAEDGSTEAIIRSFLRKEMLTSWQIDRLRKGDPSGFFFGGCKVLFHLAEGTFARVYRGVKPETGSAVAIKVLRQRFAADPMSVELFKKEADAGTKLRHENIVRILDYGEQDGRHYMIMEYVEGSNLRDFLKIRARISPEQALPLMLGLARGLKYSLDQGVTHRDIKATNILISNSGEAKLVDFGLATIEGDSKDKEKDKKGGMASQRTVDYSTLERTCGSPKGDPRSDIFFLGGVFYRMLTGKPPMPESESKDMLQKMLLRNINSILPLSEHPHSPDPELARIIERMMRVELKSRYQTMDEVLTDLEAYEKRARAGITGLDEPTEEEPEFLAHLDDFLAGGAGPDTAETSAGARTSQSHAGPDPAAGEMPAARRQTLLCVEAQTEIQDALRKSLTRMGYRVILVTDAERAAERYRESSPDAVLFDFDGLEPDEAVDALVDMRDKAVEDDAELRALVLLGPRQKAVREKLPTGDHVHVLSKPVKMKQVQHAVRKIMPSH